jgi:hypothetical protein
MSYLYRLGALVLIAATSAPLSGTKAVGAQAKQVQSVSSTPTEVGPVIDAQADV